MPIPPLPPMLAAIATRDADMASEAEAKLLTEINRTNAFETKARTLETEISGLTARVKELTAKLSGNSVPTARPRIVFPPGRNDVGVWTFGAKGDGRTDDTAAIQRAISASIGTENRPARIRLFGRHVVTDTLVWRDAAGRWSAYGILCGTGPDTGLCLPPNCQGFTNPLKPKAVVMTANNPWQGMTAEHITNGTGFAAFQNFLADLYVEIGTGNVGAVGVNLRANNVGGLDNVHVRGPGYCGVSLEDKIAGPLLLYRTSASGCTFGLRVGKEAAHYSVTAARCWFSGKVDDIWNDGMLTVEGVSGVIKGAGRLFRADADGTDELPIIPDILPTPSDTDGTWTVGDADTLIANWFSPGQLATPPAGKSRINHVGKGTLYIVHFQGGAGEVYRAGPGAGPVDILDAYSLGTWNFGRQRVRCWQMNSEAAKVPFAGAKVYLDGTDFRAVGIKTEGPGDFVKAVNGAKVKVIGGISVANVPLNGTTLFDLSADTSASIDMVVDGSAAVQVKRGGVVAVPAKPVRGLLKFASA